MAIFHDGPPTDFATRPATPQTVRGHRMLRPPLRVGCESRSLPLHRVHHHETQLPVKRIPSPNHGQCGAGKEGIVRLPEGVPVGAQNEKPARIELAPKIGSEAWRVRYGSRRQFLHIEHS